MSTVTPKPIAGPRTGRGGLLRLIGGRILWLPVLLLGASALTFTLAEVVPGDIGRAVLGPFANDEQVAAVSKQLGLDRPIPVRYAEWLSGFIRGDWGESFVRGTPVRPLVLERAGASLLLALYGVAIMVPLALLAGTVAALRRGRPSDRILSVGGLTLSCIPEFVTGVVLLVVFGVVLGWFPTTAAAPSGSGPLTQAHAMTLPALSLAMVSFGYLSRLTRASTITTLDAPYVRTARLKGLRPRAVITRHVLPNSLLPSVSVIGVQLGFLIGGLVVVETLFTYPGIGKLLLDAAKAGDVPLLEAAALITAVAYVLCILATDITSALLDPRVRRRGRT